MISRREPLSLTRPNEVCSLDFVADQLVNGRCFRALTVLDVFTRECLAIKAGESFPGAHVVAVLNQITNHRGPPKKLFCDNVSEFTSQIMDLWAYQHQVKIDFSRPDKPADNAYIESFNGTLRRKCLNTQWFMAMDEAKRQENSPEDMRATSMSIKINQPEHSPYKWSRKGRPFITRQTQHPDWPKNESSSPPTRAINSGTPQTLNSF